VTANSDGWLAAADYGTMHMLKKGVDVKIL